MTEIAPIETKMRRRRPLWRRLKRWPIVPILLLAPMVICGLFGPWLYPHDPTALDLGQTLKPPAWLEGGDPAHLLGTDQFGRDLLSRLIEGARITLLIAIFGVFAAALVGIPAGMVAGYFGGVTDNVVMRLVDTKMAIPPILLILLIGALMGGGIATILLSVVLAFWSHYARVIRGETLVLRDRRFVDLAKVAGRGHLMILVRHIFPNLVPTCMVVITLQLGTALILEAGITFIGLGIQPPATAWGLLIAEGRNFLSTAWWIPTFAGLAITGTVLGANLMGDWVRDALDPRLRSL